MSGSPCAQMKTAIARRGQTTVREWIGMVDRSIPLARGIVKNAAGGTQ
ncbi:MAG: hypothetical protein JW719_05135 [Pirellulales bacterium]|nr:hypothetical protein [Pirellulales bacterium]